MYPIIKISRNSINMAAEDGQTVSYAQNGTPRIKIENDKTIYTLSFTHTTLNRSQQDIVNGFYDSHKKDLFEFQDSDSGKSYQMRYMSAPTPTNMRKNFTDIQVRLIGTINEQ